MRGGRCHDLHSCVFGVYGAHLGGVVPWICLDPFRVQDLDYNMAIALYYVGRWGSAACRHCWRYIYKHTHESISDDFDDHDTISIYLTCAALKCW